jgi:SulP family sulfate permease
MQLLIKQMSNKKSNDNYLQILSGLKVACLSFPLSIAFGAVSGLGAINALYATALGGIVIFLFGSYKFQINGATGPLALIILGLLSTNKLSINEIAQVIFFSGIIQIVVSLSSFPKHLGKLSALTITSFSLSVALIILTTQLGSLFSFPTYSTYDVIESLIYNSTNVNLISLCLILLTVSFCMLISYFFTYFLSGLFSLIILSLVLHHIDLPLEAIGIINHEVIKINSILSLPTIEQLCYSMLIAFIASYDSGITIVTQELVDKSNKNKTLLKTQLLAHGISNTINGLLGLLPVSGSQSRSHLNYILGGASLLSIATHSMVLLIIATFFPIWISAIPKAIVSGILIFIAIVLIRKNVSSEFYKFCLIGKSLIILIALISLIYNLLVGIVFGLLLKIMLNLFRYDVLLQKS